MGAVTVVPPVISMRRWTVLYSGFADRAWGKTFTFA